MSRSNSPTSSVEEVAVLSPDAVRRRNYALAERSGHVLDLTETQHDGSRKLDPGRPESAVKLLVSLSPETVRRINYASAEKSRHVVDLTKSPEKKCSPSRPGSSATSTESPAALIRTPTAGSPALSIVASLKNLSSTMTRAESIPESTNKSIPSPTGRVTSGAQMLSSSPSQMSPWQCQRCPSRVRNQWMKLCEDCHRKRPPTSPIPNDAAAVSSACDDLDMSLIKTRKAPRSQLSSQSTPNSVPFSLTSPVQVSQPSPIITPTYLDDFESGPYVPQPTSVTVTGIKTCQTCSARLRDSWMTHCRQCHESTMRWKYSRVDEALCLDCRCTLRHAWMTWCCDCYEQGFVDAQRYQKTIQDG